MTTSTIHTISIDDQVFHVHDKFIETLEEIAFLIRTNNNAEVLQQAVALLYLVARERHEKQVQTYMHYPDGGMRMLQFWKNTTTILRDVAKQKSKPEDNIAPEFKAYNDAMADWRHYRISTMADRIGQPCANEEAF